MTLVGKHIGVISLGLCCQTAFQLATNKDFLSKHLGEKLEYKSSFFNWLLSDSAGIASFIKDYAGRGLSAGDIVLNQDHLCPLQVSDYRLWLWHEKWTDPISEENLRQITSKYDYLLRKFWEFKNLKNRYFIISNCQNNLEYVVNEHNNITGHEQMFDFYLSDGKIGGIESAVNAAFPSGSNSFYYAIHRKRTESLLPAKYEYHEMPCDDSEWKGSTANWQRFLNDCLPRHTIWLDKIFRR